MLPPNPRQRRRLQAWPGRPCRRTRVFCIVGALMVVMGLPARGWAQSGVTVTGVVENETGALIPYVRFTLLSPSASDSHEAVTDLLGRFSFQNIAPGPYVLEARARGYEPAQVAVAVGVEPLIGLRITVKRDRTAPPTSAGAPAAVPSSAGATNVSSITGQLLPPVVEHVAVGPQPTLPPDTSATAHVPALGADEGETKTAAVLSTAPEEQIRPIPGSQGVPPEPVPGVITRLPRLWSVGFTVSNSYDSNIDHDLRSVSAYGLAYGTGVQYQSDHVRPLFRVAYDLTRYSVPGAGRWSRLSHHLRTTVERRLNRRLYVDLVGDFLTSGTSEDRELANHYLVRPRVEYRLPRDHRIRFYAAHRLKRYANTAIRDATNQYAGLELQRRFESGDRWQMGYRYEENRATGPRYRYRRLTYETEYTTVITERDTVTLEVVYRSQRYYHRFTEVDDIDVPRHNQRWIPSLWWVHRIGAHVDARLDYIFDTQSSNDLDEPYTAQNIGFSFGFRW